MKFKEKILGVVRRVHATLNAEPGARTENMPDPETVKPEQEEVKDTEFGIEDDVVGDVQVADEVISVLAAQAAQEVPGVISTAGGIADDVAKFMGKEKAAKGVRIAFDGKMVLVTIYLVIEYGFNIPELALNVQERVKNAVENMAGYEVQSVDVHIENVRRHAEVAVEQSLWEDEEK